MIVVTVGTQLPFDRLVEAIDSLAPKLNQKIFAQIGPGRYMPKNIDWSANVEAGAFDAMLRAASVIVSHAGIGTVLKAYKYAKPIILMPRQAVLGEHRNDHQLATVSQLGERPGIYVANNESELQELLQSSLGPAVASDSVFLARGRLQDFVFQEVNNAIKLKRG